MEDRQLYETILGWLARFDRPDVVFRHRRQLGGFDPGRSTSGSSESTRLSILILTSLETDCGHRPLAARGTARLWPAAIRA